MPSDTSYNNAAAWQTAGQLVSTAANVTAQSSINRRTMKYNKEMVNQQRQWALEDWQKQNDYNHPSAQMARFREAKLNPNLIYGQTQTADAVRTTQQPSWNPQAPDYSGIGDALSAYQDMRIKQAQYDNLRTQNTIMVQDALLRAAQVSETGLDVKKKSLDYSIALDLKENSLEAARLATDKLREEVTGRVIANEELSYRIMDLKQQIGEATPGGLNLKKMQEIDKRLDILDKQGKLMDFEIELNKFGAKKGDPYWMRAIAKLLTQWGF